MVNHSVGNPLVRAAVRTVLTGGALAASFGMANAQQQVPVPAPATPPATGTSSQLQLQEVVVTGSRIAVPNQTSISPVTFVNANTFSQMGATRVEDVLNRLPQVFAAQNSTSINGGTGTETVDLRGLNAKRTLVLVDGLRLGPGDPRRNGSGSDLKMVPTALIDDVQILTGGASSIYGADAVAGVVNFKLNDHFEGVKLVANGGGYFHNNNDNQGVISAIDAFNTANASSGTHFQPAPSSAETGAQKQITFIAGINSADGKGNATFFASYRNISKATQNLYSYSACSLTSGFLPAGKFTCGGSGTSYPGLFEDFVGGKMVAKNTVGPGGALLPSSAGPLFNFGPLNYMQAPDITWNAGAFMHYELNSHATVYANTMFMDDVTALQIAPSGDFGNPVNVDCANPFLSAAELTAWCHGSTAGFTNTDPKDQLLILRRNVEGGNRVNNLEHTDWRLVLGLRGAISDNWTYDVNYQHSIVNVTQHYDNDLSIQKMNYALDAVGTASAPQCAATAAGITTGLAAGCVPWNIFAPGQVTPAMTNYLNTPGELRGQIVQQIIDTNFTGDLGQYVQLPTAHSGLRVALGTEYIDVSSYTQPDAEFQTGDLSGQGGSTLPVSGAIESWDEYLEARLPLLEDKPFARSLTTDDSIRHSHYALGFDTNTFSLGLAWAPTRDVRVRGTFTRAVRAPNVVELFAPQNVNLDGTSDPCAGEAPKYSAAQCANEGVSAAQYGTIQANTAAQYNGKIGGNPSLKPETALTTSVGVGITPHWVPNLRVQIDYYDIKIKDIIRSIGENTILNDCASADLFCSLVHRDALGSLWLTTNGYVVDTLANVGNLEEKGIDFDIAYSYDFGRWGRLSTSFNGNYLDSYLVTPVAAAAGSSYDCVGFYGSTCSGEVNGAGGPVFKWRHNLTATWETPFHPLSVTVGWRYMDPVTLEQLSPNPNLGLPGKTVAGGKISNTDARIPSFSYFDLSAGYQVTEGLLVRLGVNNLFDKDPPVIGAGDLPSPPIGNGNTMPGTYDWGGRFVFGEISAQF